jgi:hypothetical protein
VVGSDWAPGPARIARWFRYRVPQLPDGRFDPLAIPPIADTMPPALIQKLAGAPALLAPSLDLTVHFPRRHALGVAARRRACPLRLRRAARPLM